MESSSALLKNLKVNSKNPYPGAIFGQSSLFIKRHNVIFIGSDYVLLYFKNINHLQDM